MKKSKATILATCGVLLLLGVSFSVPNYSVDYCTTKGYGFPILWRVDHCLCHGEETVYYPLGVIGNLLVSAVAAAVIAVARRIAK